MPERTLERRFRLLAARFRDGPRGPVWEERLPRAREALDVIVHVLAHDLAMPPPEIDGQHVQSVMTALLPARLAGDEPYKGGIVDLLEEFLLFVAEDEGLTTQWEWSKAVDESREPFLAALRNPSRGVLPPARHEPDRRRAAKVGRNDPCPCGSGRKYKQCCLKASGGR